METRKNERIICCIIATILFFVGMSVETTTATPLFSGASEEGICTLQSVNYIAEVVDSCTPDMLSKSRNMMVRGNVIHSVNRWNSKVLQVLLVVGAFLQDLLYYQSTEGREDGQLFLCRSVAVNYIHLKDSGE